jgi:translation initiation factor eIF-2B subunit alpha/methylthioribose-1-phosphate isomerase
LAAENQVPFYIAAPISTFDLKLASGAEIPIEERGEDEVLLINKLPITGPGTTAKNPAFDVTPHKYITGFITEFGVIKPSQINDTLKTI